MSKESVASLNLLDLKTCLASNAAAVLNLNNRHAIEMSLLDASKLQSLIREAFYARAIGEVDAFLLAFDQDAKYDSPNFAWFKRRLDRFVYVDRVAVSQQVRGRGYARRLYRDLAGRAADAGRDRIVCEVNLAPPNPASDELHRSMGFVELGRAETAEGSKVVRYLTASTRDVLGRHTCR